MITAIVATDAAAQPQPEAATAGVAAGIAASARRQPITGMQFHGARVAILVDASASMLDRAPARIDGWLSLTPAEQRQAPKWRFLITVVEGLTQQLPPDSQFQLVEHALRALRDDTTPRGQSNLYAALALAASLQPSVDTIVVVTDGIPATGPSSEPPTGGQQRRDSQFMYAVAETPLQAVVNVILLPKDENDTLATQAYEFLALGSGGSLLAPAEDAFGSTVVGVPLDSEYLVFAIDTSNSMLRAGWNDVIDHVTETLNAYPSLKGIRVLSDEGEWLFPELSDDWIPNTPDQIDALLKALQGWAPPSTSDPSEGILAALELVSAPPGKAAIYVYGDDFTGDSLDAVWSALRSRSLLDEKGNRMVRIHAIAFPVYYNVTGRRFSGATLYAALMRDLAQKNGGTFVSLPVAEVDPADRNWQLPFLR